MIRLPEIFRSSVKRTSKVAEQRRRLDLGDREPDYAIYAIGDVHGCVDLLRSAEDAIVEDVRKSGVAGLIVLLGDYVDRGPNSAAVIDHLMAPTASKTRRLALCGNHDDLLLRFFDSPRDNLSWLEMGGRETLSSYGLDGNYVSAHTRADAANLKTEMAARIPETHIAFLRNMPVYLKVGRYLFAHAGVRPGVQLEAQTDEDLMWIREPFISRGHQLPFMLIHGHTPFKDVSLGPNRIGIDTGAYVTGKLAVLKISEGVATRLTNVN